jgi:hypothetical protein
VAFAAVAVDQAVHGVSATSPITFWRPPPEDFTPIPSRQLSGPALDRDLVAFAGNRHLSGSYASRTLSGPAQSRSLTGQRANRSL